MQEMGCRPKGWRKVRIYHSPLAPSNRPENFLPYLWTYRRYYHKRDSFWLYTQNSSILTWTTAQPEIALVSIDPSTILSLMSHLPLWRNTSTGIEERTQSCCARQDAESTDGRTTQTPEPCIVNHGLSIPCLLWYHIDLLVLTFAKRQPTMQVMV